MLALNTSNIALEDVLGRDTNGLLRGLFEVMSRGH